MIATKIGFFAFRVHFGLKIKIFSTFILYFFTQNCMILMFYLIGVGQNVDIYPSKLETVGDKNRPKFFKANFIPLKLTSL